ncbi:hypothetical protein M5K25_001015 [Dendrobium thyrsiflorum]|uniref:Disease resistance N-terminal domain-containing protein n=1 Tax=Dendrobium thyrsiflorum TaxID=117978 RepID=A0ABD0VYH7_DENTH
MADIIAMFSRWAKSGLSALLDGSSSSSSSVEPTRGNALDDFQRIMQMLPRIEAVLEDAEEREIQDKSMKLWLSELRHLVYDIDDMMVVTIVMKIVSGCNGSDRTMGGIDSGAD